MMLNQYAIQPRRGRTIAIAFIYLGLLGCQGAPIRNEYPEVKTGIAAPSETPGMGKVVIVNEAIALFSGRTVRQFDILDRTFDKALGTATVDIYIGGKGLKKLSVGEYAQVLLRYGTHEVEVDHTDIVGYRSRHRLEISSPWTLVVVYPRPLENRFDVVDSPAPGSLEKLIEAK